MSLSNVLRVTREKYPDKTALIGGDQTWTYERLDEMTGIIAARLLEAGIRPGDRVALHFSNRPEIVFCYYACFKIGAVAVPLNIRLKATELEYNLNHSGARLYIGEHELFPEVQTVRSTLMGVERYYLTGSYDEFPGTRPMLELTQGSVDIRTFPDVSDETPAAILYTSGTTARPKGVTHTHGTLERKVAFHIQNAGLQSDDIVGAVASACHIAAFALQVLPALTIGATLVLIPRFDPGLVLSTLQQHQVTQFFALPVMYNALLHCPGGAAFDLSALRWCLAGGDAVPTELQRRFKETFGAEISEGCGMTELVPYCINRQSGDRREGSIGKPSAGVTLRLVGDAGREVPTGEIGEIVARSEAAMIGYWNDPEATAATLKEGWLYTGDLGRIDEDGYYWFVGRKKEIIVRGGSNISPPEVEEALYQHPAVREAAVIGVPHPSLGETVAAYVTRKEGTHVSSEELQQFLRERIAVYKVPETITFLPELPKGPTGKIHRQTLRARAAESTQG